MKYGLNEEQWNAVSAPSPVIVNASAGSGKTRCLTAKIRHLLESGVHPTNVCAVTFTNKAANEMKERLRKTNNIEGMQVSTIHSMCVRIVKKFPGHTVLKVPFSIYDEGDQADIVKTIIKARDWPYNHYDVLSEISRAKSAGKADELEGDVAEIYKQYQNILFKNNAADFDDLLIYARDCLKHIDCKNYFGSMWTHLLVDEVQDTSAIQYEIVLSLYNSAVTRTLFLVGDYDQSVYSWRGARPQNMQEFIHKYKPTVCNLTFNYRSCPEIISEANNFLQFGKAMIAKSSNVGKVSLTRFDSYDDESERIALAIQKMQNFEETAILYRVNSRSLLFEKALATHRIPYVVVGALPFYRRKHVKILVNYLKCSVNTSDLESLVKIVNEPKRGFGEAKKEKLLLHGRPYLEQMATEMSSIKAFLDLLRDIRNKTPLEALREVLYRTEYVSTLVKDTDIELVNSLLDVVAGYNSVEDLILASSFLEEDYGHGVKLMTAHASKGLEFDRVFVVGVEDGLWPHKNSEDYNEECRLFYVSLTRARRWLNVSYSKSRMYRGQPLVLSPSPLFKKLYQNIYKKDMQ